MSWRAYYCLDPGKWADKRKASEGKVGEGKSRYGIVNEIREFGVSEERMAGCVLFEWGNMLLPIPDYSLYLPARVGVRK